MKVLRKNVQVLEDCFAASDITGRTQAEISLQQLAGLLRSADKLIRSVE